MPTFKFEAMDTTGGEVKDSVDALSEDEAQQKIRQMGYFVTKITEVAGKKCGGKKKGGGGKKKKGKVFTIGGVNSKALVQFTRQFSTMIDAGLPLVQCLNILADQSDSKNLRDVTGTVARSVEEGSTLAESLRRHPRTFDDLYTEFINRHVLRQHPVYEAGLAERSSVDVIAQFRQDPGSMGELARQANECLVTIIRCAGVPKLPATALRPLVGRRPRNKISASG